MFWKGSQYRKHKKIQNTNDSKYIDCTYKKSSPRKSYIQYSIHISIKLLAYLRKIFLASTITYMNIYTTMQVYKKMRVYLGDNGIRLQAQSNTWMYNLQCYKNCTYKHSKSHVFVHWYTFDCSTHNRLFLGTLSKHPSTL